ncbi:MAG: YeeE/YedE thiosulfate transporter family protein [Bacillota bacterium]
MVKKLPTQFYVGFGIIALVLLLGFTGVFGSATVFAKTLIGMGFGYALTRGDFGFAGLSNKTCRRGSTKLIRFLVLLFAISSVIVAGFLIGGNDLSLWIRPISWGLLVGGLLFGVGMAFSSCCATGVLQDMSIGFSRAIITLFFFGAGVFLGFPLMSSSFAQSSLFQSGDEYNGIWFPDWFAGDNTNGIIGALVLTIVIAALVAWLAKWYEKKISPAFEDVEDDEEETSEELTTYERYFVKKWSMTTTVFFIATMFGLLYAVTGVGWGASTPFGQWFGALLHMFGVSAESLASFTNQSESAFTASLFDNAGWMQNIGIIIGAALGLLLAGNFVDSFKNGLKIKAPEILLFALGGFLMGFGTRLSLGCNVGALYTPIANFSLSGWLYFFVLFAGGYIGNKGWKAFYQKIGN